MSLGVCGVDDDGVVGPKQRRKGGRLACLIRKDRSGGGICSSSRRETGSYMYAGCRWSPILDDNRSIYRLLCDVCVEE